MSGNPNWLLGVDVETTGLEAADDKDVITEVGAVLWDVPTCRPLAMLSATIALEPARELTEDIQRLTGITPEMVAAPIGRPETEVLVELMRLAELAGWYVAHNAPFDRSFLTAAAERNFLELPQRPWIDTSADVPYPAGMQTRKLVHLAAEHGFLNPLAHRAVFDVLTMLKLVGRYPFEEITAIAKSPPVLLVGRHAFEQNNLAKACGFRWDASRKEWTRLVKWAQLPQLKADIAVPYVVEPIGSEVLA